MKLAERYAKRFCEEFPDVKIEERPKYFSIVHKTGDGRQFRCCNGEFLFGPSETWPAQIDGFLVRTAKRTENREISYNQLRALILFDNPEITGRSFLSQREYLGTMTQLFDAAISGMVSHKLESLVRRGIKHKVIGELIRKESQKHPWMYQKMKRA